MKARSRAEPVRVRLTAFAPQSLVGDLDRPIAFYRMPRFAFGEPRGGFEAVHAPCVARGASILGPLADTAWGTKDADIEDPDRHVLGFGGRAGPG